jgi:hypothetical protein
MTSLPAVLDDTELPLAERMAARLDGELYALRGVHCPVDEIERPALRLGAALAGMSLRLIAELGTAAWVWGAAPEPARLELCVDLRARTRPLAVPDATVREVVSIPSELAEFGGRRVTTPLRTAIDLARSRAVFGPDERATVAELAAIAGFTLDDCLVSMNARRNLPAKHLAAGRLREVL